MNAQTYTLLSSYLRIQFSDHTNNSLGWQFLDCKKWLLENNTFNEVYV